MRVRLGTYVAVMAFAFMWSAIIVGGPVRVVVGAGVTAICALLVEILRD